MQRLAPEKAHALMLHEGYAYLDVRSVAEFEAGHPEGAYNVPLAHLTPQGMQENAEFVAQVRAAFPLDQGLVVGCASGVRSLKAANMLVEAGYAHIVEQEAGFEGVRDPFGRIKALGWRARGLPVSTSAREGRSYAEIVARGAPRS